MTPGIYMDLAWVVLQRAAEASTLILKESILVC